MSSDNKINFTDIFINSETSKTENSLSFLSLDKDLNLNKKKSLISSFKVYIPSSLHLFFTDCSIFDFNYQFHDFHSLKIESDQINENFNIFYFSDFINNKNLININFTSEYRVIFLLNKVKFLNNKKSSFDKQFKNLIKNNKNINLNDLDSTFDKNNSKSLENSNENFIPEYEKINEYIYDYQLEKNTNIIFIENLDQFKDKIKTVYKIITENKNETIKARKFKGNTKEEYLQHILMNIPGISKNISKKISQKYKSTSNLNEILIKNKETFENFEFTDENNKNKRKINKKVFERIYKAFTEEKDIDLI